MNKYFSLVFLYNRASCKKTLLAAGAIPLSFLAIFFLKIGNPYKAGPYMLMERAFGGPWAVLLFAAANLIGLISVAGALSGRRSMKAAHATTGYTIRRLRLSPISSYITIFIYYLIIILIFWSAAIASLYAIGKTALTMAGTAGIDTKLALGLLRTDIGHVLIPMADPVLMIFNIISAAALAAECAKSCYLSWHNGRMSAGVILVVVSMALVWLDTLDNTFIFIVIVLLTVYTVVSFGDVISREKHPKGDPFKANQYAGVMDVDGFEFDESSYAPEANRSIEIDDSSSVETSQLRRYGRVSRKGIRRLDLLWQRRRYMPLGINLERANSLFGAGIAIGIVEHSIFTFRYKINIDIIKESVKGVTLAAGVKMPYFCDLQEHAYYGYIFGMLMVACLQTYRNYEYYNKKTRSVYVMKRLPDRKEYSRTIWVAPVIQALLIALIMAAHTALDLCMYILATPKIALYPDYLSHLLPF